PQLLQVSARQLLADKYQSFVTAQYPCRSCRTLRSFDLDLENNIKRSQRAAAPAGVRPVVIGGQRWIAAITPCAAWC
ncbi:hypothetical protein, partial [Pseudomonas sp. SM4]|uniref:hypothetical protein n=1 Tax=Pseudomonas sp. SM4 TaxID=3424177 RepID=UPI003F7AA5FE